MGDVLDRKSSFGENRYIDTRAAIDEAVPFTQAVIDGLAPSGGLYVPQSIPRFPLERILELADLPYSERAADIYSAFNIDIPDTDIHELMHKSYGDNFDTVDVCPIQKLDEDVHVLELWHGPTSAFKDMALQCLPNFFAASADVLRERGQLDNNFCILVATSGDTGKAALEGFKGVKGVNVGVLFPDGGVSDIQRKQMVTTTGDNVCVWAVRGNFDDCQTGVKKVFGDDAFASQLKSDANVALSSANSINWGRLLPQIVYYVSSYAELVAEGNVSAGDPIDVCVPTGNFGNILAAWYARQMGTPIENLFCASNENRVLTDFINTGIYDISDREFVLTPSPSMDILVSSNLERQLFELSGRNGQAISEWMTSLNAEKRFQADPDTTKAMQAVFKGESVSNNDCLNAIKSVFDKYDYLMDPHTAVSYTAGMRLRKDNPLLIISTAHWAKFGDNVYRALHGIAPEQSLPQDIASLTGCQLNELIAKETGKWGIPKRLANLDAMPIRFSEVIDGNQSAIEQAIATFLEH
ncbi:threonine synthase [Adlercreutzia sp. ZJ304]|uniref:threonine synthase n=1 Tax=Adlercreutzia sp. ZJ304 TaxID=2709791 RepID=UPI0013EB54C4|nr:threonine synthase [Adlercreutzia sp. ZJ304]